jgi:hypothetical protein
MLISVPNEVVNVRIAEIHRARVASVGVQQRRQALGDSAEGLLECGLAEPARFLDQRLAKPVRVLVKRLRRHPLGAQEASAEDVLGVAANLDDPSFGVLDREPARRLAQRAGAKRGD